MAERIGLLNRIGNYYLLVIFILSPAYVTSMRQGNDSFFGLLADVLTLPAFVWPSILLVAALIVLTSPRPMPIRLWLAILIGLWSLFVSYAKAALGVFDAGQPGIIWIVVFVMASTLPLGLAGKTIYLGLAYLSVVNLILSLSQLSVGFVLMDSNSVLLAAFQGDDVGFGYFRGTGIFNTPLALGCFGVFASFALAGMRNWGGRFHWLWVSCGAFLPIVAIAKTAIFVLLMLVALTVALRSGKRRRRLSTGLLISVLTGVIILGALAGIVLGHQTDQFSAEYKPAAIISFLVTVLEHPQLLVWGMTDGTVAAFEANMATFIATDNASLESWMLRLIALYGLPFFAWFVWMAYVATKSAIPPVSRWYIGCAFGGLILTSIASNGGAQPPTSFFVFALAGITMAHIHDEMLISRSNLSDGALRHGC